MRIWYAGLSSPELHIARVRARVFRGGHDISEATIRERYDRSRLSLIRPLPKLTELLLQDSSKDADQREGVAPEPKLIIHVVRGKIVSACDFALTPEWAKPIVTSAMGLAKIW